MTEFELIERAQTGDKAAYTELIHIHHRTVEKFAFQCGVRLHDIPDVTQEVFVKLYRFLHQFKRDRFKTWLYKITLNTARDYYRKEMKQKKLQGIEVTGRSRTKLYSQISRGTSFSI
ncbi:MAG: sigma-70 family RNA polymerase sigma factor [Psychrobacillus psychrotolerans]